MYQARRRRSSTFQLASTLLLLATLVLLTLSAITRQAVGEPVIPQHVLSTLGGRPTQLPPGLNYQLDLLDPQTLRPLSDLPQVGTVETRLALTNDSALPMTFRFPNSLQCEFIARKLRSYVGGLFVLPLEVWRSSYFHNIARLPSVLTLRPGETKVYVAYWSLSGVDRNALPPGEYRLYASFQNHTFSVAIGKPL